MITREPAWLSIPAHAWLAHTALRGARRRGTLLEVLLVVTIVGVLITVFARALSPLMVKVSTLEAVSLFNTQRADAVEFRATTGHLPTEAARERATTAFAPPFWQDGELVYPATGRLLTRFVELGAVERGGAEPTLSFRLATAASGATVWLCGSRDAPPGFTAAPMRHTTIPEQYLLHYCRSATPAP